MPAVAVKTVVVAVMPVPVVKAVGPPLPIATENWSETDARETMVLARVRRGAIGVLVKVQVMASPALGVTFSVVPVPGVTVVPPAVGLVQA